MSTKQIYILMIVLVLVGILLLIYLKPSNNIKEENLGSGKVENIKNFEGKGIKEGDF